MKNNPSPEPGQHRPARWNRFLWWLATAEKELLAGALTDQNRYAIIGYTVLGTWAFATLAWSYFFSTVSNSIPLAAALGLFMGCIILFIDRALIKSIQGSNRQRWQPLVFRGLLALTIGAFMAQPALLYLFRQEITLQTATDNQYRLLKQKALTDSLYAQQKTAPLERKQSLQNRLDSLGSLVNAARDRFLAEADGSGGTGKVGISTIALAKQKEYLQLDSAYREQELLLQPLVRGADSSLLQLEAQQQRDLENYAAQFNEGFLTRIEALQNLLRAHPALQVRYFLLLAILLLIELMPVIAKSLLPAAVYEERVALRESMEKKLAARNSEREAAVREHYNQLSLEHDQETIRDFFASASRSRAERLAHPENQRNNQPFSQWWDKMKNQLMAGQRYE